MGLRMHVPGPFRIATLNTVCVPEGIDEAKVRRRLLEGPGIEIAGGFGPLAGKIFRIGVMGPLATESNLQFFLKEFEQALKAEGYSI
jgi:alanine-glyoxylate transaminase/serine-glyoxylate transaminase/serine-pyruvate transaminase